MPPRTGASILPGQMEEMKKAEWTAFEPSNVRTDIGETKDRIRDEPGRLADLKAKMQEIYLGAREETPVWPEWAAPAQEGGRAAMTAPAGTPTERAEATR
jgi:hypothetical protein